MFKKYNFLWKLGEEKVLFYTRTNGHCQKLTSLKLAINLLAIVRLSGRKPARKGRGEELTMH